MNREVGENVISEANVKQYVDETNDGGYWYTVDEDGPKFVDVTDKALEIFGYDSLEDMVASGMTPHTVITPLSKKEEEKAAYWDFVNGKGDQFKMDCLIIKSNGEEFYGQIFIARSRFMSSKNTVFRVMMQVESTVNAIFRQSRQLLDGMSSGVVIIERINDEDFRLKYANEGYAKILGGAKEDIKNYIDKNVLAYAYEDDYELIETVYHDCIRTGKNIKSTYRILDFAGEVQWVKAEHKKVSIGTKDYLYVYFMDITNLMNTQMEIQTENERLFSFINNTPAGIAVFNIINGEYTIKGINATVISKLNEYKLLRTNADEELVRRDFDSMKLEEFKNVVDKQDLPIVEGIIKTAEATGFGEGDFRLAAKSEQFKHGVWVRVRMKSRKRTNGTKQLVVAFEDISKRIEAENELKIKQDKILNLIYYDALTGVLNRMSYNEFLKQRGHSKFKNTGIAFVDLNGLKVINDLYGHSKGDDAIKLTVMLIQHYFEKDEIYRLSGDNFVIIEENVAQEVFYSKMDHLLCDFNKYDIASLGYNWDETITNIAHNIDKAEAAERVAKQDYYVRHMEDKSKHRPQELDTLLQDLSAGRYVMYLQPKAYTDNTTVVAAESLIRRVERDGRVVSPIEFVPMLEKERLVPYLDFFMLEETCRTLEKWNNEQKPSIKISVNMSRVTLAEPDYINRVLNITDKYDISHSQVEFEITESQETMDRHKLEDIVQQISKLGFGVSLDDMGTEYSSVMMLTMKGIDTVKIDRGFVLQMGTDEGQTLVRHIINMCHELGELCIAEGVEDHDTRILLNEMGCDMYQGYLLAKPIPVSEFEQMIAKQHISDMTA